MVRVKYGSGIFWIRVKYGSGVFQFCGFQINPTGRDRHIYYSIEKFKLTIHRNILSSTSPFLENKSTLENSIVIDLTFSLFELKQDLTFSLVELKQISN